MEDIWTKRPGQTKAAAPILLLAACAEQGKLAV